MYTSFVVKSPLSTIRGREVQLQELNNLLNKTIKELANDDYEIISVSPIISSCAESVYDQMVSYTYTSGFIILTKR